MRTFITAVALATSLASVPALALSPASTPAAATAANGYSVADTDIGTLLDDPAARAIVDKYMPGFSTQDNIDMARSMTLTAVQQYKPEMITDDALANVQAGLSKLPKKK